MDAVRRLASLAHGARQERKLPVRQPLARMQVAVPAAVRGPAFDELLELLRLEVNVKAVEVVGSDADLVRLRGQAQLPLARQALRQADAGDRRGREPAHGRTQLRGLEQGRDRHASRSTARPPPILPEDVVVEREVASDWIVASDGPVRRGARSAARPRSSGARAPPARW